MSEYNISQDLKKGTALKLASHLVFAFCGVQLKWLSADISIYSLGMWAGFFGALGCLSYLIISKNLKDLILKNKKLSLLFVPLNIGGFSFSYLAFNNLSMLSVTLIYSLVPVITCLLSWLILKEKINLRLIIAIALSLIGVFILIFNSKTESSASNELLGYIAAFTCILLFSIEIILMRYIGSRSLDHPIAIITYYYGCLFIFSTLMVPILNLNYVSFLDYPLVITLGLSDFIAVGLGYLALIYMQASKASLLAHTQLIWAALFDYFVFDITPTYMILIGAALIIIGTSLIGEKKNKQAQPIPTTPH